MHITGTVKRIELGMGFWGIETADGRKLRPLELPAAYHLVDRPIHATVELLPDVATAEMWGEVCRLISVE